MPCTSSPNRILWITEEPPDRNLGGGSIRQAHLFEAVAAAFPTDLLLVGSLQDEQTRQSAATLTELPKSAPPWSEHSLVRRSIQLAITLGSQLPSAAYPAAPSRRRLGRALKRTGPHALACVEHESLAPLAGALGPTPALVSFHHLLSEMIKQELAHRVGRRQRWLLQRDLHKAINLERRALASYERVITCSEEDAAALRSLVGGDDGDKVAVIPNGVDLSAFDPTPLPSEPRVLFPGSLNYAPNVDAAVWFCREIWPRVRAQVPGAELLLAGREPVVELRRLAAGEGIALRANVASMAEWFAWARVVVVPLRIGTGTRLKALEAMAAQRAIVGTEIGLAGVGVVDGTHALVADRPDAIAQAVVGLLQRDDLAERLARAAREHAARSFDWGQIGARYVELISALLAARRPAGRPFHGDTVGLDGGRRG